MVSIWSIKFYYFIFIQDILQEWTLNLKTKFKYGQSETTTTSTTTTTATAQNKMNFFQHHIRSVISISFAYQLNTCVVNVMMTKFMTYLNNVGFVKVKQIWAVPLFGKSMT